VHKSVVQEARVNPQPVWHNRDSSSHYKLSIWQVVAADAPDQQQQDGRGWDSGDRFFVAVSGHTPPTTPVYILRPGVVLPYQPPASDGDVPSSNNERGGDNEGDGRTEAPTAAAMIE
jgi:hypothetical protein